MSDDFKGGLLTNWAQGNLDFLGFLAAVLADHLDVHP